MTKGPLLLLFFLCLLFQPTLSSQDPKVLTILKSKDIFTLDPGKVGNVETLDVVSSIFEGLVHYDVGSLSPEPCLAERWESDPQGLRWVFFLRKGVYFHDGREVDSSAVLYTFQQRRPGGKMPTPQWASLQGYIASIKALDRYRIEILLNKTFAPFLSTLAEASSLIVPVGSYERTSFQPIGTGPYRYSHRSVGENVVLLKNPRYWNGAPKVEKVVFKVVPQPLWRILQMKNGTGDASIIRSAREWEELTVFPDLQVDTFPIFGTWGIVFNLKKPLWQKLESRRAMAYLFDKPNMVKEAFRDLAKPASSPVVDYHWAYCRTLKDYPFDPSKSKELFQRGGGRFPSDLTLLVPQGQIGLETLANRLARTAKGIGLRINVKVLPTTELQRVMKKGEYDLSFIGWVSGGDPHLFLAPWLPLFDGRDPLLETILTKAAATVAPSERAALYCQVQERLLTQLWMISLFHPRVAVVHRRDVKGLGFSPLYSLVLNRIIKETYR